MKVMIFRFLLTAALVVFLWGGLRHDSEAQHPLRCALLVGVADYPPSTGWSGLASSLDLEVISQALVAQGFAEEEIDVVKNPDKQALVQALERLARSAAPGGVAVFHFSGHGQLVVDTNGDELTGFDQSLVPADACVKPGMEFLDEQGNNVAYYGQNHLIDDELALHLAAVRRALTPTGQLVCIMDACHSGSSTRNPAAARGTVEIMKTSPTSEADPRALSRTSIGWLDMPDDENALSPVVALYACQSQELNAEYKLRVGEENERNIGSLTYAVTQALALLPSEKTTWGDVFKVVQSTMSVIVPGQTPYAEGDLDAGVFLQTKQARDHQLVLQRQAGDTLFIRGGHIMNVYPGTHLRLVDLGLAELSAAEAVVFESDVLTSQAILSRNQEFSPSNPDAVQIEIVLPSMGSHPLRWACPGCTRSDARILQNSLKHEQGLLYAGEKERADVRCVARVGGGYQWEDSEGNPVLDWPAGLPEPLDVPGLVSKMRRWSKVLELKNLVLEHPGLDVTLQAKVYANNTDHRNRNPEATVVWGVAPPHAIALGAPPHDQILELTYLNKKSTRERLFYTIFAIDRGSVLSLDTREVGQRQITGPFISQYINAFEVSSFAGSDREIMLKWIVCNQPIDFAPYFLEEANQRPESADAGTRGVSGLQMEVHSYRFRLIH